MPIPVLYTLAKTMVMEKQLQDSRTKRYQLLGSKPSGALHVGAGRAFGLLVWAQLITPYSLLLRTLQAFYDPRLECIIFPFAEYDSSMSATCATILGFNSLTTMSNLSSSFVTLKVRNWASILKDTREFTYDKSSVEQFANLSRYLPIYRPLT